MKQASQSLQSILVSRFGLVLGVALTLGSLGCGQKGDLVLPPQTTSSLAPSQTASAPANTAPR